MDLISDCQYKAGLFANDSRFRYQVEMQTIFSTKQSYFTAVNDMYIYIDIICTRHSGNY